MSEELIIEKVNDGNFEEFFFLVEKLAEYEKLEPPDQDARARLKKDRLMENPRYEAYLGKLGSHPVAYIIYFFNYSSFLALSTLYLEDIYVLEEFRRKGIGTKLFELKRRFYNHKSQLCVGDKQ